MTFRSSRLFLAAAAALAFLGAPAAAQKIDVDASACPAMFTVLSAMRAGRPRAEITRMLEAVLDSSPYRAMFRHYNRSWRPNHLPRETFRSMILSLRFPDAYRRGTNARADAMLDRWRRFYADPDLFERNLRQIEATDLPGLVKAGVAYAQTWLPPEWPIPDFRVIIHPNGGSPGFALPGEQGLDFFQLPRDGRGDIVWGELVGTIAHESHHLGLRPAAPPGLSDADAAAFGVLSTFVGEGTATKFISKAPGGSVPALAEIPFPTAFRGDLLEAWIELSAVEGELFGRMIADFDRAAAGRMSAPEADSEARFWLGGLVGPAYLVGSEMFGAIQLALGKPGVFSAMRDPRRLFELYARALDREPVRLSGCPRLPAATVARALAIGARGPGGPRRPS